MAILFPSADSRRVIVSYKGKYLHEVLVNCLVKLAQEKVWLGDQTEKLTLVHFCLKFAWSEND